MAVDIVVLQVRVTTWPDRVVNYPVRLVFVLENVWLESFYYSGWAIRIYIYPAPFPKSPVRLEECSIFNIRAVVRCEILNVVQ